MLRMVRIVDHQNPIGQPQPRAPLDQRPGLFERHRLDDDAVAPPPAMSALRSAAARRETRTAAAPRTAPSTRRRDPRARHQQTPHRSRLSRAWYGRQRGSRLRSRRPGRRPARPPHQVAFRGRTGNRRYEGKRGRRSCPPKAPTRRSAAPSPVVQTHLQSVPVSAHTITSATNATTGRAHSKSADNV